jgi:hypothetical protein
MSRFLEMLKADCNQFALPIANGSLVWGDYALGNYQAKQFGLFKSVALRQI